MRGLFIKEIDHRTGQKLALMAVLVLVLCVLFIWFSHIHNIARTLGEDVYVSWSRLERSIEAKAEASALLAGYLAQSSLAQREMFERMFKSWEDVVLAESQAEKMDAGKRANNESYGIIAMARSNTSILNDRAKRIIDRLDSMELSLASDIKNYNDSFLRLHDRGEGQYSGRLVIAFSGCEEFGLFPVGREAGH